MGNAIIKYGLANNEEDIEGILALQMANLAANLSTEEAQQEGFVTVVHDLLLLKRMNSPCPHIVAKVNDKVIGYTLVMLKELSTAIPILVPMFKQIEKINYKGEYLQYAKYFIMGQVCIDKAYRGKQIFKGLYNEMKERMKSNFDYIITEVSTSNKRSLNAHFKVGFEMIKKYKSADEEWDIILWRLK